MNLYVESTGSGPPVVFLHGVANSSRSYAWLALEGRTNIRFDLRGHGGSDRAPGAYRLQDYVEDALSVLDRPAFLVGHSLGGVVAWTVAQRRPDLVTGLFLEDPPLYMGIEAEHAANPAVQAFVGMQADVARYQAEGLTPEQVTDELAAEALPDGTPMRDFQTPEGLASRGYALAHLDTAVLDPVIDGSLLAAADTESPVEAPTIIVAADDALGAAFPSRHEAWLKASHPHVEVLRLPGASHSIHDQRSTRDAYLRELTSRA